MHFTAIVASAVLAMATGANAWAQDANGVWTANNWFHTIRGGESVPYIPVSTHTWFSSQLS